MSLPRLTRDHTEGGHRFVTLNCTMPEALFHRGRAAGLVFSRVLQSAVRAELGETELDKIELQLAEHSQRVRILSAAKARLLSLREEEREPP